MSKTKNEIIQHSFIPGSEWIYYKLYCGPKTSDKLLTGLIKEVSNQLLKQSIIDQWFYIRYADPDNHLRIRFHVSKMDYCQTLIQLIKDLSDPYFLQGLIHRIQIDTYHREIERYGTRTMEYAEMIFFYDSEMCIQLLEIIKGEELDEDKCLSSLMAVDALLDDFQYTGSRKLELLRNLNFSFAKEFNKDTKLAKQISTKYRKFRNRIDDVIFNDKGSERALSIQNIIRRRSERIKPIADKIIAVTNKTDTHELDDLCGSYIHMMMNRLFRARQRTYEMVLYDFLFRTYKSYTAKNKYRNIQ